MKNFLSILMSHVKHVLIICLGLFFEINVFSQNLNAYKYMYIPSLEYNDAMEDTWGLSQTTRSFFRDMGFVVLENGNEVNNLDYRESAYLLIVGMNHYAATDAWSRVSIKITDVMGNVVYNSQASAYGFLPQTGLNRALKKLLNEFSYVGYHFDESIIIEKYKSKGEHIDVTEEQLIDSIDHSRDRIVGIYTSIGDNNYYKFAIIKNKNKYLGVTIESDVAWWRIGDIKFYLEKSAVNNLYTVEWYMANKTKEKGYGSIENGALLKFSFNNKNIGDMMFLKAYPSANSEQTDGVDPKNEYVASGSGFFISDRIIATNNHVVEGANNIKIVVKNEAEVRSYSARVLITDKTNDLALVSITDKEFKGIKSIPYSLFLDTKEVGTSIFTMGYPMSNVLGSEIKITDGIISSKTGFQGDIVTYQITAPIQPGNSGGALFDKNGVLVGITNAGVRSAENVGYAIKTVYLKNLIDAAPVYIELPQGRNLKGKELPELVKILSPYVVFVEVY